MKVLPLPYKQQDLHVAQMTNGDPSPEGDIKK